MPKIRRATDARRFGIKVMNLSENVSKGSIIILWMKFMYSPLGFYCQCSEKDDLNRLYSSQSFLILSSTSGPLASDVSITKDAVRPM